MNDSVDIDALRRIMPPHEGAGMTIDWAAAERAWGMRFPADYRAFMSVYGPGIIEDYLIVMAPEVAETGRPTGAMGKETLTARDEWDLSPRPEGVSPDSQRLVTWGLDAGADLLCWLMDGPDPDQWPVAMYRRGKDTWELYQCGMVEFLCRIFAADFEDHPLSGVELWGVANPRFLTRAEERRIKALGQDPWAEAP